MAKRISYETEVEDTGEGREQVLRKSSRGDFVEMAVLEKDPQNRGEQIGEERGQGAERVGT